MSADNLEAKIKRTVLRAVRKFEAFDEETIDCIQKTVIDIMTNKGATIDEIRKNSLIKIEDMPNGYTSIDNAVNIANIVHTVISEYLSDAIDWWMEIALNQYRHIATVEARRITDTILDIYSKKKDITVEDVRDATYKTFFRNTPRAKVEILIPKDNEITNILLELVDEYKKRKNL